MTAQVRPRVARCAVEERKMFYGRLFKGRRTTNPQMPLELKLYGKKGEGGQGAICRGDVVGDKMYPSSK